MDHYKLIDAMKMYVVRFELLNLFITLTMTQEAHDEFTGTNASTYWGDITPFWFSFLDGLFNETRDFFESFDTSFWSYNYVARSSIGNGVQWLEPGHSLNEYKDHIKIRLSFGFGARSDQEMEYQNRIFVDQLFSDSGALAGFGADNDLKTDFEKLVAIYKWLDDHVYYSDDLINAHTAYGVFFDGKAVCEGYAIALGLLLHNAGVEGQTIVGRISNNQAHAWNWVHIGPMVCM